MSLRTIHIRQPRLHMLDTRCIIFGWDTNGSYDRWMNLYGTSLGVLHPFAISITCCWFWYCGWQTICCSLLVISLLLLLVHYYYFQSHQSGVGVGNGVLDLSLLLVWLQNNIRKVFLQQVSYCYTTRFGGFVYGFVVNGNLVDNQIKRHYE